MPWANPGPCLVCLATAAYGTTRGGAAAAAGRRQGCVACTDLSTRAPELALILWM